MKILLLGDASNYHRCLSTGLCRLGHDVTVASQGSKWMNTGRDIDLSRGPGKLSGALLWTKLNTVLSSKLKGYDVVQICSPVFVDLRPGRVNSLFKKLKRDNGAVFLTALGTDPQYVEMCKSVDCPLRYNEYYVDGRMSNYALSEPQLMQSWLSQPLLDHCRYVYDNIDGAVSALYEYHLSCLRHLPVDKVAYAGIPVDMSAIDYKPIDPDIGKVNVMVACHKGREIEKGIDILLPVLKQLEADNPGRMHLDFVQNLQFAEFQAVLGRAHIVVDQLYSYTPATTALMAMAAGKIVVSGAEPEYYSFIGEPDLHPIINPDPTDIEAFRVHMQSLLDDPTQLASFSRQGHDFALKHNDVDVVARRFIDFWERRIG